MNSKYAPIVALTALGVLVIFIIGWFALISPQLSSASDLRSTREDVEQNTARISTETAKLAKYQADLTETSDLTDSITLNLPGKVDVPSVRERIIDTANKSKMEIYSLDFPASFPVEGWEVETRSLTSTAIAKLFQTTPISVDGVDISESEKEGLTLDEDGKYVPPVPANRSEGPLVNSLFGLPVTFSATGTYEQAEKLLASLQDVEKQMFIVDNVNLTARNKDASEIIGVEDAKDGDVILTVTGSFYYLSPSTAIVDEPAVGPASPKGSPFVPGDSQSK